MNTVVQEGSLIRSNDPRYADRDIRVTRVAGDYAFYKAKTRTARIRLDRIHNDGKQRQQGYRVVTR